MSVSVAALALARVLPRAFAAILVLLLSVVALLGRRASALLLIRELRIIALALGIELLSGGARAHRLLRVVRQKRISNSRDFERILLIILKERGRHGLDPRDGKQDHRLKELRNGDILVLQTRELLDENGGCFIEQRTSYLAAISRRTRALYYPVTILRNIDIFRACSH